jgi:hypothetical protein
MPDFVKRFADKKYLWDGKEYSTSEEAQAVQAAYVKDGFEAQAVREGEKYLVYSRRVAAQQAAAD